MSRPRARKLPRAVVKILPFCGTILWPLPGEIEPVEIAHPPVKPGARRRIPQDAPKDEITAPKPKAPDFRWLPQG